MTCVYRVSGEHLDDVNIRLSDHTFLIAGHETTSGTVFMPIYGC